MRARTKIVRLAVQVRVVTYARGAPVEAEACGCVAFGPSETEAVKALESALTTKLRNDVRLIDAAGPEVAALARLLGRAVDDPRLRAEAEALRDAPARWWESRTLADLREEADEHSTLGAIERAFEVFQEAADLEAKVAELKEKLTEQVYEYGYDTWTEVETAVAEADWDADGPLDVAIADAIRSRSFKGQAAQALDEALKQAAEWATSSADDT